MTVSRYDYARQKFGAAIDTLATSFAPGWQRMYWAAMHLMMLRDDDFPDGLLAARFSHSLKWPFTKYVRARTANFYISL